MIKINTHVSEIRGLAFVGLGRDFYCLSLCLSLIQINASGQVSHVFVLTELK